MRYSEIINDSLTESFSSPVPYIWITKSAHHARATFVIDNISYRVNMYEMRARLPTMTEAESICVFTYGIDEENAIQLHGSKYLTMKPTKSNRSFSVLSTVISIFDDFVKEYHPPCIWFSDTDHIPGRKKLYQRYYNHLIEHFGYVFDDAIKTHYDGEPFWFLRAPETINENINENTNGWLLYHGSSSENITGEIRVNERDAGWFGPGFYLSAFTEYAQRWGKYVFRIAIPTTIKFAHIKVVGDYEKIIFDSEAEKANQTAGGTAGWIENEKAWALKFGQSLRQMGYGGVRVDFDDHKDVEVIVFNPSQLKVVDRLDQSPK